MNRSCLFFTLASMLLHSGCFEDRPPAGYKAVPAATPLQTNSQCPDLTGSFNLSKLALGGAITAQAPPDTKGLPVLMTLKQGVTNTEAWWVVPKDSLRRWAESESQRNPAGYSRWRALVMRPPGPQSRYSDIEAFRNALAKLGPAAGPVFAGVVSYRCAENWMEIRDQPGYRGTPRNPDAEGMGEKEIWLGRDQSGTLLVKTLYFKVKPIRVWGDSANTIRTSSSATWSKVEKSPFVDPVPLTESDLPAAPQMPSVQSCDEMMTQLAELTNRIARNAPIGVYLVDSKIQTDDSNSSLDECQGRGKIMELQFSGKEPEQLARIDEQILSDPLVKSVLVLQGSDEEPSLRRLRIVLK